jgi:hypothetical protein
MRHIIIILLLTFGVFEKAFSDVGNCVKYEVEVGLNDGRAVRGFVFVVGYERKFTFTDITFLDYLKRTNPTDTLVLYKGIQRLKFPALTKAPGECEVLFDAASPDNVIKIFKDKIKVIKVIKYGVCNNCDIANEKTGYNSNGIYPTVIIELTKSEIELLQTKPLALVGFGHDVDDNTDGYWMMSYNPQFDQTELEAIRNDFLLETNKLLKENNWDKVQVRYRTLKSELREKKIIVFKIEFAL